MNLFGRQGRELAARSCAIAARAANAAPTSATAHAALTIGVTSKAVENRMGGFSEGGFFK